MEEKAAEIQASINLETGPLMKLGLFKLDDGHRLLIVLHHMVIDGVSWRILLEDIETLYHSYKKGKQTELPLKTDSFKLWSQKLTQYADSRKSLEEKNYWVGLEAQAAEIPRIPKDFESEDNRVEETGNITVQLSEEQTGQLLTRVNEPFGTEINDILLTVLGQALKRTWGLDKVLLALEGHGREEIIENIDISRTVGWFTTLYPVILEMPKENELAESIKAVKENLHRVPKKGIGYGILKYLTTGENRNDMQFTLEPRISFNYLGQVEDGGELKTFTIAPESAGRTKSPGAQRDYELGISAITANKQLNVTVSYGKKQFKSITIETLAGHYKKGLEEIITYCTGRKERELTPVDLTYKELTLEQFEQLNKEYGNKIEDIYPLAPMQKGLLFQHLYDQTAAAYFEQISFHMHEELEIPLMKESLNRLLERYEILRAVFLHDKGENLLQAILKDRKCDFSYEDISGRDEKEEYLQRFKEKDKKRNFQLAKDVMIRLNITRLKKSEYRFTWSFHHILMDGWCLGILIKDYLEIYRSLKENRRPRLPEVKPYRGYIQWVERRDKEESKAFWKKYLDGYDEQAGVPAARKSGHREEGNGVVTMVLDAEKTRALNNLAAGNQVTLNTLINSTWGIILGKYNDRRDVTFGAVVSGRPTQIQGIETMVGLFINTIPVRVKYDVETKFNQLLRDIQQKALDSEPFHYYPLAEIQAESHLKQNLMDHITVFENYPVVEQKETKLTDLEVFEQTNYRFNIVVGAKEQLSIKLQYDKRTYDSDIVGRITGHFRRVFQQVLENEETNICHITLLTEEEREQLLYDFNDTALDYPKGKTLHEIFGEQVERTPDRISVVSQDPENGQTLQMSYRELENKSNRLARYLQDKGVATGMIIALMAQRSTDMVIGLLGILKTGAAYLPIEPGNPGERVRYMLADSNAAYMLSAGIKTEIMAKIAGIGNKEVRTEVIDISEELNQSTAVVQLPEEVEKEEGSPCYIIYTSGTTGRPKGVSVRHSGFVNLITFYHREYGQGPGDRMSQVASPGFDAMAFEVWPCLLQGANLHIAGNEVRIDPTLLQQWLITNGINITFQSTAIGQQLVEMEWPENSGALRTLLVAGDRLGKYPAGPLPFRFYNLYGPTEDTVWTTYTEVKEKSEGDHEGNPSIGKPIGNHRVYILSTEKALQPVGAAGEICIAGEGLAAGYLNNPELTAERFVDSNDIFSPNKQYPMTDSSLYLTGDIGRWQPDGRLEFLGRTDTQVKIRGYRI
ncbi:MAG: amino acid adenylation domain-containing protein, partial [bacterium]|nr:amino acid adenylation domain-containing protein [bacterium]